MRPNLNIQARLACYTIIAVNLTALTAGIVFAIPSLAIAAAVMQCILNGILLPVINSRHSPSKSPEPRRQSPPPADCRA